MLPSVPLQVVVKIIWTCLALSYPITYSDSNQVFAGQGPTRMSQPHLKLEHEITEVNSDTSSEYQEEASLGLDGFEVSKSCSKVSDYLPNINT